MDYISHLKYGILLEFITLLILIPFFDLFNWSSVVIITIIVIISPLFTDLDHPTAKLTNILLGLGLVSACIGLVLYRCCLINGNFLIVYGLIFATIIFFLSHLSKHRGFIHSIAMTICYGFLLFVFLGIPYAIIGTIGYYSHLICDKIPFKIV